MKGFYSALMAILSQSTIKMDKGYYAYDSIVMGGKVDVAIHNKNGQGLLPPKQTNGMEYVEYCRNPQ